MGVLRFSGVPFLSFWESKMKQKIIEHIQSIKDEKSETIDGLKITKNLAQEVGQIARQAFMESQNTDSIDSRIEMLVKGLQDSANHVVETFNWLEAEVQKQDTKIETLEALLAELNDVSAEASEDVEVEDEQSPLSHEEEEIDDEKKE